MKNKLFKKIFALMLTVGIASTPAITVSGCGKKESSSSNSSQQSISAQQSASLNSIDTSISSIVESNSSSSISSITSVEQSQQNTASESISASELTTTSQTPVEYITVQSIVDEVFADIDFDANLKTVLETLIATGAPKYELRKMLAFEYNVVNEIGECVFYAEYKSKNSIDKSYISTFTVSHQNIFNFIFLSIDFESKVSEILNSLDNNINSSIVKDSIDETQIYAKLTQLKDAYLSEMAQLESTEKANIVTNTLFIEI